MTKLDAHDRAHLVVGPHQTGSSRHLPPSTPASGPVGRSSPSLWPSKIRRRSGKPTRARRTGGRTREPDGPFGDRQPHTRISAHPAKPAPAHANPRPSDERTPHTQPAAPPTNRPRSGETPPKTRAAADAVDTDRDPAVPPPMSRPCRHTRHLRPPRRTPGGPNETKQDGQRVMAYLPGDGMCCCAPAPARHHPRPIPNCCPWAASWAPRRDPDGEVRPWTNSRRLPVAAGRMAWRSRRRAARRAAENRSTSCCSTYRTRRPLPHAPYARRRAELERSPGGAVLSTPAALTGQWRQALRATREHGLAGLVCNGWTRCRAGVRSRAWIKIRNLRSEDCSSAVGCPARAPVRACPARCWFGSARPAGCVRRQCGPAGEAERTELAVLLRAAGTDMCLHPYRRWPGRAGWCPGWSARSAKAPARAGMLRQPSWLLLRPTRTRGVGGGHPEHEELP